MLLDDKVYTELTKELAWDLLQGICNQMDYDISAAFEKRGYGKLLGGGMASEYWEWNTALKVEPANLLFNIYQSVKTKRYEP